MPLYDPPGTPTAAEILALLITVDGPGSTLDADTLDGISSAGFTGAGTAQPLDADLTTIAGLTATTDSFMQAKASAWAARTVAQVKTDLGLTGTNSGDETAAGILAKLVTVDGAGSGLDADLLDGSSSAAFQPVDADLTTIAGLTATTDNFLQAKASAWASRTVAQVKADLGLTGTNSGDETAAGILAKLVTVDGAGSGLDADLLDGNSSAAFQPVDADLTTIAGLTATTDSFMQAKSSAWAARTVAQVKSDLGLTGTNSGDQTIALTGDVTGSGTGSFAATVASGAVTLAKMANLAQDQFIGRVTASTGVPETATITAAARTVLDDTTTSAMRTTLGLAIGTDVQAFDADLSTLAGLTATTDNIIQSVGSAWASRTPVQVLAHTARGVALAFANTTTQGGTTVLRYVGVAGMVMVVPAGWKLAVLAMSMHALVVGGAGQTSTGKFYTGATVATLADQSASFGTLQVATGSDVADECEPTSPPFIVDASSARQFVQVKVTNSATTGNVVSNVTVFGYMFKP